MPQRTIEDKLREQYFDLLPEVSRVAEHLKAQIQFNLLPVLTSLLPHENILVKSRVKDCPSAIDALRRRGQGGVFDVDKPEAYNLLSLRDLAGVRVLAFPSRRVTECQRLLRDEFANWTADFVYDKETRQRLAFKYYGHCSVSDRIIAEYQITSTLTGLFWEVEHAAIYKPAPHLKGIASSLPMRKCATNVTRALHAFEEEFEHQLKEAQKTNRDSSKKPRKQ